MAGRERCHEEATRTAPGPAEPHGPRRCGGPEHSVGLSMKATLERRAAIRRQGLTSAADASATDQEIKVKAACKVAGLGLIVKHS